MRLKRGAWSSSVFPHSMTSLTNKQTHTLMPFIVDKGHVIDLYIAHSIKVLGDHLDPLRGYCTPGQFLDCVCIFLKNYNTLVTSKICFL